MKSKSKFIMRMMIFVMLVFSSSIFVYNNIITVVKSNEEKTISDFKKEQFDVIWSSLNTLSLQSEKEVSKISSNIENDILALSDEKLEKLQYDMNTGIHNEDLHNILMKNIEHQSLNDINNHRNGLVIMSNEGFIEDFNYRRANLISDKYDKSFRQWEESIKNSYNKELDENAIDKLLNRTSGIIALESYNLIKNNDHIKIKELNYDSLMEVYLKEGIEGLRNYQIFVPYYITDIGDIFGNLDITQGIKSNTNKIIVVQEFNLYDQIISSKSEIFNTDEIKPLTDRYDNLLRWLYIFGILSVVSICLFILYFLNLYFTIVEYEDSNEDNLYEEDEDPTADKIQS